MGKRAKDNTDTNDDSDDQLMTVGVNNVTSRASSFCGNKKVDNVPRNKGHPADRANLFSFATFSWMSRLMYSSFFKKQSPTSQIPSLSIHEECGSNTDIFEQLWTREVAMAETNGRKPSFGNVLWKFIRFRAFLATLTFMTSIVLGFIAPTVMMRRLLMFSSQPDSNWGEGAMWVSLLILCEFGRVFFFTLTWGMSYRTAIRVKAACMGLVYRKIFRIGGLTSIVYSKLLNVISSDCARIYDVLTLVQVSIGGPVVLIMSVCYIVTELGWQSLLGLAIFPLAYPVQYFLAKSSGNERRKAIHVKDNRVSFMSQAVTCLKFIKMSGWEPYFQKMISDIRLKEKRHLQNSQFLQSFGVVLGPSLPHVGAIITFIMYINAGYDLTPAQAFCTVAAYFASVRPTIETLRTGLRAYFEGQTAISRLQCFTILFLFSLFGYSIRSITQISSSYYTYKVALERTESVLVLPEVRTGERELIKNSFSYDALVLENVSVLRKGGSMESGRKSQMTKGDPEYNNSIERLLNNTATDNNALNFRMEDLNLSIKKGSFVGICGPVGSGKSTLLELMSGSISIDQGKLRVNGTVAYAPQDPWLFNGSLRDNIVFGELFDSVRYYNTIHSCCLVNDFAVFPRGDLTEALDNGLNLSGGQRQRISLARALYHSPSKDIYLLDNPFSGLDTAVSKTIFTKGILDILKKENKTILLVLNHQVQFLKHCDEIIVFDNEGKIAERGTHDQLLNLNSSHYSTVISNCPQEDENGEDQVCLEDSAILDCSSPVGQPDDKDPPGKNQFNSQKGSVPWNVYKLYVKCAGGFLVLALVLLAFGLSIGSTAFSSWWLKSWFKAPGLPPLIRTVASSNETIDEMSTSTQNPVNVTNSTGDFVLHPELEFINMNSPDFALYRDVYAGLIAIIFCTSLVRTLLFVFASIKASQALHTKMLTEFFRSRLKYIEQLGIGQILHLFSRDLEEIDSLLPNTLEFFMQNSFIIASVLVLVSIIFPMFLGPLLALFLMFLGIRKIYNSFIQDLKRSENEAKTPVFTIVNETLVGLGTIRAFGKEKQAISNFENVTNKYHSVFYIYNGATRWASIRLDALAVAVTGVTALLILIFHGSVSAAASGLALSYAAQLSGIFQYTVRLASETESRFVCVERMKDFLKHGRREEEKVDFNNSVHKVSTRGQAVKLRVINNEALGLHHNWPFGRVKFDSVYLSYGADSVSALKDVSFEVHPGQKIGIVGRTGSGKSSIGSALFRLQELKSGNITLDDANIANIPLSKLRSVLCVIPQDAIVFQNSIRFNLDPGCTRTDDELWTVLRKTGLTDIVDNLDAECAFSHGQRQLFSVARALLQRSNVVFVDEATSNIDVVTAAKIDNLLATEFYSKTMFIVAHRLSALSYCDYLLIMDNGEVRDFGPVEVLVKKPEFYTHFEKFDTISLQ